VELIMTVADKDLVSVQEARQTVDRAYEAQKSWGFATQQQVDQVCEAMAQAAFLGAERLGRLAADETGFGVPEHKKLKNEFASQHLWNRIKDIKTVGMIRKDEANKIYEIAWPMGVVGALIPSTNPTSTVMNKILISVKARDGIVVAPHPTAVNCSLETAKVMIDAAEGAGAPPGLINCLTTVSLQGTQEMMAHKRTAVILATGGSEMVRVAHSQGKPAYGVGPGNVPAYVDRSADLEKAAKYIVASKAFDYSVICATEQAVIADRPIAGRLQQLMEGEGAYFVDESQANALRKTLFHPDGSINVDSVGKSPQYLAAMAGIRIPAHVRILVAKLNKVGKEEPLSREKMTTVLAWYESNGWEAGCERCIQLINFGGRGHSLIIHATDEKVLMAFALEKPVFRIGVNTMGTLGTIGLTTNVMPSLTLGPGGIGGSITGDNVGVYHLFNIKRMAFETSRPPDMAMRSGTTPAGPIYGPDPSEIEIVVEEVVKQILRA
jgi:acetaldehyde dehydrogenase (acetylating)